MLHRNVRYVGWLATAALGSVLGACTDNTNPTPPPPPTGVPAVTIEVVSAPTSGPVGEILPDPVIVKLSNPDGSVAANQRVSFSVANGGIVENAADTTDANGLATSGEWKLGRSAGSQRLVIGAAAINTNVDVTAEPLGLKTVRLPAGMEGGAFLAGIATTQEPVFVAVDSFNNRIAAGTNVTFTALEGSIATSPVTVATDALGNASPGPWTLGTQIGPQRIRADYVVGVTPVSTTLTVEAGCSSSQLAPSSSIQGQWRSTDCRTATQRIQQYTLTTPPVGNLPAMSAFGLSVQGVAGQSLNLLSTGKAVQLTPPSYLYSTSSNPYQINYALPPGNYDARALSPSLSDNFFTLTRSGTLDVSTDPANFGGQATYPMIFPVGCGEVGNVPWFTAQGIIAYGQLSAPNACNAGGFGVQQDRYIIELQAGDTLNPTIINWSAAWGFAGANTLSLRVRDASTAGGAVVATGTVAGAGTSNYASPDGLGTATNANIIFIGNIEGVNGFVAPATGPYEIIVGTSAANKFYQVLTAPPIKVTTTSLPAATVGTAYSAGVAALGGKGTINFSVSAGALPPKFAISAAGAISGSPEAAAVGTYNFTVSAFAGSVARKSFSIVINP